MKQPQPNWRENRKTWVCRINGKWVTLAQGKENKQKAWKVLREILLEIRKKPERQDRITFKSLFSQFMEAKKSMARNTIIWYEYGCTGFSEFIRAKSVSEITPSDIHKWLQSEQSVGPAPGTQARAIEAISSVLNWGVRHKLIAVNPIKGIDLPAKPRRERIITEAEKKLVYDSIKDEEFRDFMDALWESGARPGEIANLEAKDIDFDRGIWIIHEHKTKKKTGKPRIIYMTEKLATISKRLSDKNKTGPIFLNTLGNKWNRGSWGQRMEDIRAKFPQLEGVVLYCVRHSYATDALEKGIPPVALAELMGHQSTRMIEKNYGHLDQKTAFLKEMAKKAASKTFEE